MGIFTATVPLVFGKGFYCSQRIFESFCKTCHDNVALKSSILVNYVTRSALQKCKLDHNTWPHFISAIQTEPGKLNFPNCETPTDDPVSLSGTYGFDTFV